MLNTYSSHYFVLQTRHLRQSFQDSASKARVQFGRKKQAPTSRHIYLQFLIINRYLWAGWEMLMCSLPRKITLWLGDGWKRNSVLFSVKTMWSILPFSYWVGLYGPLIKYHKISECLPSFYIFLWINVCCFTFMAYPETLNSCHFYNQQFHWRMSL